MNNQSSSNKKTWIIGISIVVVLGGIWYFYTSGGSGSSTSQLVSSSPGGDDATAVVGANVLGILNSISSINIDTSIFSSEAYQSLVDYSIAVPAQPVGRPNPFAPTGGIVAQQAKK